MPSMMPAKIFRLTPPDRVCKYAKGSANNIMNTTASGYMPFFHKAISYLMVFWRVDFR